MTAIIKEKCISKRNSMVLRAFEKVWTDPEFRPCQSIVNIALNCNTQEERTVALLHNVFNYSNVDLRELQRKLDFNDAVLSALECFQHDENEDDVAWIQRIAKNKIARKVKIEALRDSIYDWEETTAEKIEKDREMLRMLQSL